MANPFVPDWVYNPKNKIRSILFGIFVGGLSTALTVLTRGVYRPINSVVFAFETAGAAVDDAVGTAANSIMIAESSITQSFIDLGTGAGLAAPLANAAIVALSFALVFAVVFVVVQVARLVNPQ